MKWYVEYYDKEGFWYLDDGFDTEDDARAYADKEVVNKGFDLERIYQA